MPINVQLLEQLLPSDEISHREGGGGKQLSYLESWFIIDQANKLFGFDGWSLVTGVDLISTETDGTKTTAIYKAKATVVVDGRVTRTGFGVGRGISVRTFEAHELGIKEAESDAMKRAFRTFGNQFGNCLYDKTQAGVDKGSNPAIVNTFAEGAAKIDAANKNYAGQANSALQDSIGF
jgi:DNA repair and recombination protein RAD52